MGQVAADRPRLQLGDPGIFYFDIADFSVQQEGQVRFGFAEVAEHLAPVVAPAVHEEEFTGQPHVLDHTGFAGVAGRPFRGSADKSAVRVAVALDACGTSQTEAVLHQKGFESEPRRRDSRRDSRHSAAHDRQIRAVNPFKILFISGRAI